jgi:hypothetical protein
VRTTEDPSGSVNVSTFEVDADGVENTLDATVTGSTVNVEPDIVRVSSPVIEALAGSVTVITGPFGSVSVSTIKGTDILDAAVTGSTVNIEPDMVRVSSPVTEALAGTVRVITGPLGSVSVSTTKDTDPLGATITGSTVNVEPDMVRVSSPVIEALAGTVRVITGPLGSVRVSIKDADPLGATVTGSTVNIEPDMVRVSSPVIEALAGRVRVTKDSPGSVSVCTIKDADP